MDARPAAPETAIRGAPPSRAGAPSGRLEAARPPTHGGPGARSIETLNPSAEVPVQSILDSVRGILDRDPSPALPLTELHGHLARERSGPVPRPGSLLERLRGRPDLFRVVEPWNGAWRLLEGSEARYRRRLDASGLVLEPWIGSAGPGPVRNGRRPRHLGERLRVGLHHLGGSLDPGSRRAELRWVGMVRQARRTRDRIRARRSGVGAPRARP